jgi:hypothetical protein
MNDVGVSNDGLGHSRKDLRGRQRVRNKGKKIIPLLVHIHKERLNRQWVSE